MANASESYIYNEILEKLDSLGVFNAMGLKKTEEFIKFMDSIGMKRDCIRVYMFYGVGKRLGFCRGCVKKSSLLNEEGFCQPCWAEITEDEDEE